MLKALTQGGLPEDYIVKDKKKQKHRPAPVAASSSTEGEVLPAGERLGQ